MNNDLISRSELKKAYFNAINETSIGEVSIIDLIDNAPTVVVDCKNCDGYEAGYSAGMHDTERSQDEIFPMEIVAGKCPIDANGDCPLRPQGECKTCRHRDPEDKKCDCGGQERQGCLFPVSDDYFCKFYEKGGAENDKL